MNLALNARDAMPTGGRLMLRTVAVTVDEAFIETHPEFAPGDYVVLEVADAGTGMTPEVQAHLFEPFFTTKETGKGTGLGLATAFGIVTQNGGHILVQSKVGAGSTFRVYLPRSAGHAPHLTAAIPAMMPHGTERVLLVEDEQAVRDIAERTLRALGYVVMTAGDGLEAMDVLTAANGSFALVLTDVRMPRCGGLELADRVRSAWPRLKVVLMSGHSEALLAREVGTGDDTLMILRKPFTASELAVCVRASIDSLAV
jgi:CheY-like chemotaxis protein